MFSFMALGVGIGCLVLAVLLRRPSPGSQRTSARNGFLDLRMADLFVPALGRLCVGLGLVQFALMSRGIAQSVILTVCAAFVLTGFVGLAFGMLPLPYPSRVIPAWARDLDERRRQGRLPRELVVSRARRVTATHEESQVRPRRRTGKASRRRTNAKKRRPH